MLILVFFVEYLTFYFPVWSTTLSILALYYCQVNTPTQNRLFNFLFLSCPAIGFIMLIAYNHFRRVLQSETLLPWLWLNFPTLLWVMVLIAKISNLTLSHVPTYSWGEIIASTLIVASVLLLHGALSRVRARYRFVIVAPVLLVLLIHLTAGFPAFGGLVLRQVGIGGGMPIDYMSRQTGPEPQHGCLVLMTSMYYFIQPFPPNKPCPTLAHSVVESLTTGSQSRIEVNTFGHDELQFPLRR